jgi:ATP-dependent DNA ligase
MLCYPTEEGRVRRLGSDFLAQPKLNGERTRVEYFHDEPVLLSSEGNIWHFCDKIKAELANYPPLPFDGEIYKHGWSRERIHSALSRKVNRNDDVDELEFHIFDIQVPKLIQIERAGQLRSYQNTDRIQIVPWYHCNQNDWKYLATTFVEDGYEGIILKHAYAEYVTKRSVYWLKFKPTEKDIYRIVGYKQLIDKNGNPREELGAFICCGDDGTLFAVGTGSALTPANRIRYWAIRDKLIDHDLIVKHEEGKTTNGIYLCNVAVEVKGI